MNAAPSPGRSKSAIVRAKEELFLGLAHETVAVLRSRHSTERQRENARRSLVLAATEYVDAVVKNALRCAP